MEATVVTLAGRSIALGSILTGPWALPMVHLFTNDVDPGPGAVVGDFTEATFTGGAALAMGAWGETFVDDVGNAASVAPQIQWDWDAGVAETVFGVYVVAVTAGTPFLAYSRFETPIGMGTTGNSLAIVPSFSYGSSGAGRFRTTAPYVG